MPPEAEFVNPPALSEERDGEYREFEVEGGLIVSNSLNGTLNLSCEGPPDINDVEAALSKKGFKIVEFEKGAAEDPREWGKAKKW